MSREARLRKHKRQLLLTLILFLSLLTFFLHQQITQGVFLPLVKGAYYQVETKEQAVALTFEVLWEPGFTREVLAVLDRYQIKSTFFLTGVWVRQNPDLAREIVQHGHEIGQHSYTHQHLTDLTAAELSQEFNLAAETFREELNLQTNLFRPPYGELNQYLCDFATQRGYTTVIWSINPHDWQDPGPDKIVSRVVKQLHQGAIIFLHANSSQALAALPVILESLLLQEYEILPFSQLKRRGLN